MGGSFTYNKKKKKCGLLSSDMEDIIMFCSLTNWRRMDDHEVDIARISTKNCVVLKQSYIA